MTFSSYFINFLCLFFKLKQRDYPDSNWGIKVLQTFALPLGDNPIYKIDLFLVVFFFKVTL